ncbi:Delta-aminolevulinic acid dehydratase [Aquicella siphonis]|uniref:Delta-aminolevulinic acid dehydratase n=1 Tax=Aquicella siphonis TaxID=254247 RepID=A0A5E4PJS4_9COXI|nr:porphobilinogen synthase [Aquicella siphonis]VVC77224.1 Delta-aminolevulinic acid dehydratase [Aquicella siphonis]
MNYHGLYPKTRLRRLRQHKTLRNLVKQTRLEPGDFVLPLFIRHGKNIKNAIASMPGHFQLSVDQLENEIRDLTALGIRSVMLFGIPEHKDPEGKDSYSENGIIQSAIPLIKQTAPELLIFSDVCFCEYTDHGHCGVLTQHAHGMDVDNDKTLALLAMQAVSHARSGADVIAPSGMIDGMVQAIRHALDEAGYKHIPVLSYSVKYSSSMYGPFRDAAEGTPKFGDRRTHQMDFANVSEAIRECALDIAEGADMLMVKPAHTYLDVIAKVKQAYPALPLGAYHTSGEFAMIKAAAQKGWLDERSAAIEILTSIRRAGADFIITYFAKEAAAWLNEN